MSESRQVGHRAPAGAAGVPRPRYQRSTGGLVGALIVTVAAVLAFAGFRALTSGQDPTPVRTVDHAAVAAAARAENQLAVLVPGRMPLGWKATSATYDRGAAPKWHLGLLTADGDYVGVEESGARAATLVEEHVDPDARRVEPVRIAGRTWQAWSDAGGDYAVVTSLAGPQGKETVLVVGTASPREVRELAASLVE